MNPTCSRRTSSAPKAARPARTRAYYDSIVKRDIFNETPQDTGPAPVVEADLNIKLIGTSLLSKSKPYAIIEDPTTTNRSTRWERTSRTRASW